MNINRRNFLCDIAPKGLAIGAAAVLLSSEAEAAEISVSTYVANVKDPLLAQLGGVNPALGNNSGNDAPAFQNAINQLPSSGGVLYIPPGRYRLGSTLNITNKSISITGSGIGVSVLIWDALTTGSGGVRAGIRAQQSDPIYPIHVSDLSLYTRTINDGTALWIAFTGGAGHEKVRSILRNIEIHSHEGTLDGWHTGIYLENVLNVFASGIAISGKGFAIGGQYNDQVLNGQPGMHYGIEYVGTGTNPIPVGFLLSESMIVGCRIGMYIHGRFEGIFVTSTNFVLCMQGLYVAASYPHPHLTVTSCQFDVMRNAAVWSNYGQCFFTGNLIYANVLSWNFIGSSAPNIVDSNYVGVSIGPNGDCLVHDNIFITNVNRNLHPGGGYYAIVGQNTTRCIVSKNIIRGAPEVPSSWDAGIWLQSGVSYSRVTDNIFNLVTSPLVNQGTNNTVIA